MPVTINGSTGLTANNGSVFTDASGNVGIGTGTPTSNVRLDVVSSATNQQYVDVLRLKTSNTGDFHPSILFENNRNGIANGFEIAMDSATTAGSGELVVRTKNSSDVFTSRFLVKNSGPVLTPTQPSAAVSRNSDFTSIGQVIPWNQVYHNVGNCYNSSNGLFTCPIGGYYMVSIMVMNSGAGGFTNATMDVNLELNGATSQQLVPYQSNTGGDYNQVSGATIISCSANDTLGFRLNSGSIYGGTAGRHCSVFFRLLG